jgi:ADP-ribosylglycohydrolase
MPRLARALLALEGLSTADAFGEQWLHAGPAARETGLARRIAPLGRRWPWTDDTAMAISIVEELAAHAAIDVTALAARFAARYVADPGRGYGGGAHQVLAELAAGAPVDAAARALFGGAGSYGNGAAMRVAPIGAFFADDLAAVTTHAARSAAPTHAHPEGKAGAIAVALATAHVIRGERDPAALLAAVLAGTPAGATHEALRRAARMLAEEPVTVAAEVGNGSHVAAADTVPFALWCAARHLDDYAAALWACGEVGGDIDTTCAIVGGVIVGAVGIAGLPAGWRDAREPLPEHVRATTPA